MCRRVALTRRRPPGAADVREHDAVGLRLLEPMPDRPPRAHVLRLLLCPHDLTEIRVAAKDLRGLLDRERIELLEPRDGNGLGARPVFVPGDVVIDLPLAEDEPP